MGSKGFQPGRSGNPSGRPQGSQNKVSSTVRETLREIVEGNKQKFIESLKELKPYEFCKVWLEMLPYLAAKHRSIDMQFNIDKISEEDAEMIVEQLKESLKNEQ